MSRASDDTKPRPKRPLAKRRRLALEDYLNGIHDGDRAVLGQAITLVESNASRDQHLAQELLLALMPETGRSIRVGITGVPGVGKSTFIEALGCNLIEQGRRVAVLAVDPSSGLSGGSILGDKTRMNRLSRDERAFVRPSPSSGSLGGVTRKTRETLLVCEAAGYDVILVETVGVGQSETVVSEMVDFFLVLMLAGAGDELQGIKRGIMELADMIAINKADGDNLARARHAKRDFQSALRLMRTSHPDWLPPVHMVSGLNNQGLDQLWASVEEHHALFTGNGELVRRRRKQLMRWMWAMVDEHVIHAVRSHPAVIALREQLEKDVLGGHTTPTLGARAILAAFGLKDQV